MDNKWKLFLGDPPLAGLFLALEMLLKRLLVVKPCSA
jgi:hypothetical protein